MSANTSNQAFNDAANIEAHKLKGHLSQDDMLSLYGLFKIANGHDMAREAAPGMFDVAGKKKRASWKAQVDKGVTVEEAQTKYIELVEQLKKDKEIQ